MNDKRTIIDLYEIGGMTIRDIAVKYNCSYETIRKLLLKNNVLWKRKYVSDFTTDQIDSVISQYQDGVSIKQIAIQYEISPPAISRLLKNNNINVVSFANKYNDLRQINITDTQKQFTVGNLLGDGCLFRDTEKSNYKLCFGQCDAQKEYFDWKISIMKPFVTRFHKSIDKRQNSVMWQTATISHQDLNDFGNSFYDMNRVKIIPDNIVQYLTPLSLAIWIMDDGSLNSNINMRIATMCFTEKEHYMLQDYLYVIFDLKSKVMSYGKKYFQLCFDKENTQKLSDIIRSHVVPCMQYKIMPSKKEPIDLTMGSL